MKTERGNILEEAKKALEKVITENGYADEKISVFFRTLTGEEAIGRPLRRDYPIIEGEEKVMEARFAGASAHVFGDAPADFKGSLNDIMRLSLDSNQNRALFIAALNAVMKKTGIIEQTVHCRDEEPEECAGRTADYILENFGRINIGLIGLNPAILEKLSEKIGSANIRVSDRNRKNIGTAKSGVTVLDGYKDTGKLIEQSRLLLVTGTTLVNGSFDSIYSQAEEKGKKLILYGVTAAGVCKLFNIERLCFMGRDA